MASFNFANCVAFVFQEEGGYSNDPRDPGGATNFGVTLAALSHWRHDAKLTPQDVHDMKRDEAQTIFRASYWNAVQGDFLPPGLDLMVFDEAVNTGPGTSAKMVQYRVSATVDGWIGPRTLAAVNGANAGTLCLKLSNTQEAYYRSLPGFPTFGKGWMARLSRRYTLAMKMIGKANGATGLARDISNMSVQPNSIHGTDTLAALSEEDRLNQAQLDKGTLA